METPCVAAVDLFCGAGGLTYGLRKAGIAVAAGIDLDEACRYPFTENNDAEFISRDVKELTGADLAALYPKDAIRCLAGCAPCRPFSPLRRGDDTSDLDEWGLLKHFARLARELKPELLTMENVPDLASKAIFGTFVRGLKNSGYSVDWRSVYCPPLGIPQHRRRLVLVASRIGPVRVPVGDLTPADFKTVRETIAYLPALGAGRCDPKDRLHKARSVSALNLRRIKASKPGGTWHDWPKELRAPCHRKKTGASFQSVYARMKWDEPSPTITTQAHNFGTGRFGHPEQDRALSLREAALLQTFPRSYRFVKPREEVELITVARLIGNAVPPRLAHAIGKELVRAARSSTSKQVPNGKSIRPHSRPARP